MVLQVITGEKTSAEICRTNKLHASVLNRWRKEFLDRATTIFETDSEHEADQHRIADLERLVGQLTMKLEIAKKSLAFLESGQKREVVVELIETYPIATVCQVLDYPSSQVYYRPQAVEDESDLKGTILTLAGQHPTYGYRRITAMLNRQGQAVNHKRVARRASPRQRRMMQELGLMGKPPVKRIRTTNSQHEFQRYPNRVMNLEIERPDQVWVGDITYIRLHQDFVYLAVLMDIFTLSISPQETLRERGWHLACSMGQSLTLTALTRGLEKGIPEIHHSDQGVQYAATDYVELLKGHGVQISTAEVGQT